MIRSRAISRNGFAIRRSRTRSAHHVPLQMSRRILNFSQKLAMI